MIRMEGIKGGGGARVGAGEDDMGDGMRCSDHPYRNNPGGICAFCLQEKLGKLVSSSFPLPIRPYSPSSSSPSFRSDMPPSASATSAAPSNSSLSFSARTVSAVKTGTADSQYHQYCVRRARLPFLLAKKKKKASSNSSYSSSAAPPSASDVIFKRSKSSATPRTGKFLNDAEDADVVIENFSPRKRNGFWSFLYLPSKPSASANKTYAKSFRDNRNSPRISTITPAVAGSSSGKQTDKFLNSSLGRKIDIGREEDDSPSSQITASASSFERKVSRSRSVGCGSRSFSGDFFERISTGFGDCTLRRVESQREGKCTAVVASSVVNHHHHHHHHHHQCMKERVKCAGIFGGLMMTSSSSSSSSSSYWVSSSADDHVNGKSAAVAISHGRAKSWGWAFASPMRAFSAKTKRDIIRDASDHKNATTQKPNLSDIPSLLAIGV